MEDHQVSVTLTGPAKIDGKRREPGYTALVTPTFALQLAASGVINPVQFGESEILTGEFEAAVRAAVAERDANWATAMDHFDTMAEDKLNEALDELQAEHSKVVELEGRATADADRIAALEAALTVATAEDGKKPGAKPQIK